MVKRQIGDRGNQPNQNIGDQGAERPNDQGHGRQQQHAAVGAEISQLIFDSRLVADNGKIHGFSLHLSKRTGYIVMRYCQTNDGSEDSIRVKFNRNGETGKT